MQEHSSSETRTPPVSNAESRRYLAATDRRTNALRLHLGCGPNVLEGWENIDMLEAPGVITHDLRKPLPFADQCAEVAFSEQFFEHLDHDEGLIFLQECFRVLRSNGTIRVTTPDLATISADYEAGQIDRWTSEGFSPQSSCHLVNGFAKNWGHKFLYDETELNSSLSRAGFVDIRRCRWRESDDILLENIEFRHNCNDLIVQGRRP